MVNYYSGLLLPHVGRAPAYARSSMSSATPGWAFMGLTFGEQDQAQRREIGCEDAPARRGELRDRAEDRIAPARSGRETARPWSPPVPTATTPMIPGSGPPWQQNRIY